MRRNEKKVVREGSDEPLKDQNERFRDPLDALKDPAGDEDPIVADLKRFIEDYIEKKDSPPISKTTPPPPSGPEEIEKVHQETMEILDNILKELDDNAIKTPLENNSTNNATQVSESTSTAKKLDTVQRQVPKTYKYPKILVEELSVSKDLPLALGRERDAIELIRLLIMKRVIKMRESDFVRLVNIYQKAEENRTPEDLTTFNNILKNLDFERLDNVSVLDDKTLAGADSLTQQIFDIVKRKKVPYVKVIENIDIYEYPYAPPKEIKAYAETQLTLGDLHGNAIKLIHFLLMHQVMSLSKSEFDTLVAIYHKPVESLTAEDLEKFETIITSANFNPVGLIRLIGDELADRGNNDYFTLLMFETLRKKNVPLEIMLSNHGLAFLDAYQHGLKVKNESLWAIPGGSGASLQRLITLVDNKLVSKDKVRSLVEKSYLPALKPISYSYDRGKRTIKIYSHAPIDLEAIKGLAAVYGVAYRDDTLENLIKTIDTVNDYAHTDITKLNLFLQNQFVEKKYMQYDNLIERLPPALFPFVAISWGRGKDQTLKNFTPPEGADYTIDAFIHGHEGPLKVKKDNKDGRKDDSNYESHFKGMVNLDTYSGRDDMKHDLKRPFMTMMTGGVKYRKNQLVEIPLSQQIKMYDRDLCFKEIANIRQQSSVDLTSHETLNAHEHEVLTILYQQTFANEPEKYANTNLKMRRFAERMNLAYATNDVGAAMAALWKISDHLKKENLQPEQIEFIFANFDFHINDMEFHKAFLQFIKDDYSGCPLVSNLMRLDQYSIKAQVPTGAKLDESMKNRVYGQGRPIQEFLIEMTLKHFPNKNNYATHYPLILSKDDSVFMANATKSFTLNEPFQVMRWQLDYEISQHKSFQAELNTRLEQIPATYVDYLRKLVAENEAQAKLEIQTFLTLSETNDDKPESSKQKIDEAYMHYQNVIKPRLVKEESARLLNEVKQNKTSLNELNINEIKQNVEDSVARQVLLEMKKLIEEKKFKFLVSGKKITYLDSNNQLQSKKVPKKIAHIYDAYCKDAADLISPKQYLEDMIDYGSKAYDSGKFNLFRRKGSKEVYAQCKEIRHNQRMMEGFVNDKNYRDNDDPELTFISSPKK